MIPAASPNAPLAAPPRITADTPVGFELEGVKKRAVVQLMGSRLWGRFNPNHWDPVYARETGLAAPIQTGEMSSAYIAEMCVNWFGAEIFRNARIVCKYVRSTLAGEVITTGGVVRDKAPKGSGFRVTADVWAENEFGEKKTVGFVEVDVGVSADAGPQGGADRDPAPGSSAPGSSATQNPAPESSASDGPAAAAAAGTPAPPPADLPPARTDDLRPMTGIQIAQTQAFIAGLQSGSQTYWDMVAVGDALSRELTITPELVILYADGVEDFNPWYEGWRMNTWRIEGESPFGGAIVPPLLVSHFALSVQFDHTKPFAIGSIHTFHDSEILEPIPVGATVRITATCTDKFVKRGRRYVRHQVLVEDAATGLLRFRETRDILSL